MGYVPSISNLGMSITIILIVKVIVKELWNWLVFESGVIFIFNLVEGVIVKIY